jgi:hypothetical protein
MRVPMNVRSSFTVGIAALIAVCVAEGCYEAPKSFQPIADGAKPWDPPAGWNPEPSCATGYYTAIDSCPGCTGISYALCTGVTYTQCVCGGPFWPGAECPKSLICCPNDFPPFNWLENTTYAGIGWAGLNPDWKGTGPDGGIRTCP